LRGGAWRAAPKKKKFFDVRPRPQWPGPPPRRPTLKPFILPVQERLRLCQSRGGPGFRDKRRPSTGGPQNGSIQFEVSLCTKPARKGPVKVDLSSGVWIIGLIQEGPRGPGGRARQTPRLAPEDRARGFLRRGRLRDMVRGGRGTGADGVVWEKRSVRGGAARAARRSAMSWSAACRTKALAGKKKGTIF